MPRQKNLLAGFGAEKLDERFDAGGVRLRLALPLDRADALRAHLRDATRDRVQVEAATGTQGPTGG
mgnify:CR=1 FL=1